MLVDMGVAELSYLMGYITGPVKRPAREGCRPERFSSALGTTIYHEAVVVGGCGLCVGCRTPQPDNPKHTGCALAHALEYQIEPVSRGQALQQSVAARQHALYHQLFTRRKK